jgi:hypothetical protein
VSTLKVNAIEEYSGAAGVTIKDNVNIEADGGADRNLTVSGSTTLDGTVGVAGVTTLAADLVMGSNDITGANTIATGTLTATGNIACGTITIGGATVLNPFKCMGRFKGVNTGTVVTISDRQNESNVGNVTSVGTGPGSYSVRITFDTALASSNYMIFLEPHGYGTGGGYDAVGVDLNDHAHVGIKSRTTTHFDIGFGTTGSHVAGTVVQYMVISP